MYTIPQHNNDISKYSFLVTGGAGFIGSHLVDYLMQHKAGKVTVLDNLFNGSEKNIGHHCSDPRFKFIKGDICDAGTCMEAMQEVDYVLHQAAVGSVPRSLEHPVATNTVNLGGFLNVLLAAREAKVKRFVYASSSSVYGDSIVLPKKEASAGRPLSPYAASKRANELYAFAFFKNYGMEIIGLRYFNIFGPRQKTNDAYAAAIPLFIDALLKGNAPVIYGDGEQTRDFTFVSNVVDANIKALFATNSNALGDVFNIAYGQRTSVNELFSAVKEALSSPIVPLYRSERAGDVKDSVADIDKAKEVLGYSPAMNVKEGLKITLEWYRSLTEKKIIS